MSQKIIYDIIHGNIEVSQFESLLLKNSMVNRLHQVLQNSVAYTVYPNMKASRFEHSLGVMNYSGLMYNYGVLNSNLSEDFLEDKANWIKKRLLEKKGKIFDSFIEYSDTIINSKKTFRSKFKINNSFNNIDTILDNNDFNEAIKNLVGTDFINRNLGYKSEKFTGVNILLYQVVRLFGLLHDIGHLPLSHLLEFSIDSLKVRLEDQKEDETIKEYYLEIEKLLKFKDKLHEVIGKNIIKYIFHYAYKLTSSNKDSSIVNGVIVFILEELWLEMMKKDNGNLNSLYSIVSSTIDSDRLDYVQRDGFLSGVAKHSGNIERVIEMYCLGKTPNPKVIDQYLFMPSIQALDSVEELLHSRYRIYRYVINHHAVLRSNYIVQKIIEEKLFQEIKASSFKKLDGEELVPTKLIEIIKIATRLLTEQVNVGSSYELINKFIQLTDYWLFSLLNNEFIDAIGEKKENRNLYQVLLVDVYKSKRSFKSLWKRDFDFKLFIADLGIELIKQNNSNVRDIKCSKTKTFLEKNEKEFTQGKNLLPDYFKLFKKNEKMKTEIYANNFSDPYYTYSKSISEMNEIKRLYQSIGYKLMNEIGMFNDNKSVNLLRDIESKFNSEGNFFVLLSKSKIDTGIKDCYLIDKKNQEVIHKLDEFSKKEKTLKEEVDDFINFFAFYYDNGNMSSKERNEIKSKLILYMIGKLKT